MRVSPFVFALLLAPGLADAQSEGVALNMGRGLDNGVSVNWTFKENWTLRPTLGAAYSQYNGFEAFLGTTVLRSFSLSDRISVYAGAGVHFGSTGSGGDSTTSATSPTGGRGPDQFGSTLGGSSRSLFYVTAPAGIRAQIYGNVEAFAETAYQRAVSGQFGQNQTGQFSGNTGERFGATFGISLRLR